jgi:hypothetical protein
VTLRLKRLYGRKIIYNKIIFCHVKILSYLCGMKLTTRTYNISPREQKVIVRLTIKWCRVFFGENHRRKNEFTYYVGPQPKRLLKQYGKYFGCFDCEENKLNVYPEHNKCVRDLIKTTIHEYTHYIQPIRSKYYKLDKQYGYKNNPFEVVARTNEKLYKNCWRMIKEKI